MPGSQAATRYNLPEPESAPFEVQTCLRSFLDEVRGLYDIVLIDNAPNLHLCSWAALIAADGLVVPLQAEDYGAQGLGPVQDAVALVTRGPNPSLRLLGFLLTMFDKRLGIHTTYEAMLRELYGPDVFANPFPLAKDFKEAVAARLPIGHYKPKSAAAKAAAAVAAELLQRIAAGAPVAGGRMSVKDNLAARFGGNIKESMGANRAAVHGEPSPSAAAPAALQGITRSRNAAEIPLEKIAPDPDQPREEFEPAALHRLAESLKSRGQLQPIRVRWDESRGVYMIVCGERRWRAAGLAGLPTMTAVIHDGPVSPAELLALQLVENCVREDLRPVEQARGFQALIDRNGWTVRQVAEELSLSHSTVVRALALLKLPMDVRDRVEAGEIAPNTAYELSKVADPVVQAELAEQAAAGKLKRDEIAPRNTRTRGKNRNWVHSVGPVKVTVSTTGDELSQDELVEALKAALAAVRKGGRGKAA